jgi:YidC/Oxa1 family membrane protein insertase
MGENNNFIFAVILSLSVLLGWQYFVLEPKYQAQKQAELAAEQAALAAAETPAQSATDIDPLTPQQPAAAANAVPTQASEVLDVASSPRVAIETEQFTGSIALLGARFDDLALARFPISQADGAPPVKVLRPRGAELNWQATLGYRVPQEDATAVPGPTTMWRLVAGDVLRTDSPITLEYKNGDGLVFQRQISVDDKFMFTISDRVVNTRTGPVTLYPFGQITRIGQPASNKIFVLHEGAIGFLGETLEEITYDDMIDDGPRKIPATTGWLGFTDKYWATALIPPADQTIDARFTARAAEQASDEVYRADYLMTGQTIAAGGTLSLDSRFFAGAKVVNVIDAYAEQGIKRFDLLIDWGWFYFLTKPMFRALHLIYQLIGNYGLSILIVTVFIKLLFFPLANRSYETMAKMKKVQPQMMKLREVYKDDKQAQQQELMKLYREEKLNPLAGCLPVLLQIPVFFALYKVLYVTLDMRHEPFYGWITDLAAPDPTSLFNLFGLIPWDPPALLMVGFWPLVMGLTMFVQMQMNPAPPDPIQARLFKYMPIVFTFLLASFPAGLVIYWAWNNFLSILQQGYIMRKNGVEIELLYNLGVKKRADEA